MNSKKIVLLFMVSLLWRFAIGQTASPTESIPKPPFGTTKDVIAPSPNAASLGIFGQIPVGGYTGTADIFIPLYEIKYKELSVPISIAYHTAGNKPDIFPGPVGLGWAIQAGGSITRTINGNPDTGGLSYDDTQLSLVGDESKRSQDDWWDIAKNFGQAIQAGGVSFNGEVTPDEYHYNINGKTGSFFINHQDTFVVKSEQGDFFTVTLHKRINQTYTFPEIERVSFPTLSKNGNQYTDESKKHMQYLDSIYGSYTACYNNDYKYNRTITIFNVINGFTMTDVHGIKYIFGNATTDNNNDNAIEFSRLGIAGNGYLADYTLHVQPMSWQLTSIESPNGYKIQFNYDRELYITRVRFSDMALYQQTSNNNYQTTLGAHYEDAYRSTLINGSVLKEIVFPGGKVAFTSSKATEQLDYPQTNYAYAYCTPLRFNRFYFYPDIAFANTEKIVFAYDNNPTTVRNRFFPHKIDDICIFDYGNTLLRKISFYYTANKNTRLKLLALDMINDPNNPQRYQFKYNPLSLPPYLSNQTDHYGFYNGKTLFAANDVAGGTITGVVMNDPTYIDNKKMPDFNYAKAEILDTIIYPTKGYTVFTYEPHDYQGKYKLWPFDVETLNNKQIDAGGVRIKSVKQYNYNKELLNSKEYVYAMQRSGTTVSSGILTYKPTYIESHSNITMAYRKNGQTSNNSYYTTDEQGYWGSADARTIPITNFFRYSSNPIYPMMSARGNHITYSEVKIIENGNGYVINQYKNYDNGFSDKPLCGYLTNEVRNQYGQKTNYWKQEEGCSMKAERGQLLYQTYYKENNIKIQRIEYKYNDDENRFKEGVRFIKSTKNDVALTGYWSYRITAGLIYTYFPYLKQKKTIDYIANDSIVQTIDYTYDPKYKLQKTITAKDSRNNNLVSEITYPFEKLNENTVYQQMTERNMLDFPLEQTLYKGNNLVKKDIQSYAANLAVDASNLILPYQSFTKYANSDPTLEKTIMRYDSHGNPLYVIEKNDVNKIVYLWSYNYQYPVAEIKNATYEQVKTQIQGNQATIDAIASDNVLSSTNLDKLNNLRTALPNAQITTYTYKPLVGVTSMTDPRGVKTTYEYDPLGRLKLVKDENSKTIENYDYHYK